MDCLAQIVSCPKCGRKILIDQILIGVSHTAEIIATCLDCLPEEQKKEVIEKYSKPAFVPQKGQG